MDILVDYQNVEIRQQEQTILRDVNLQIHAGEVVYLLGKVGSGKSSLLKTLYAELPVKLGEARILDYDLRKIRRKDISMLRRRIGIVFQDFKLFEKSDRLLVLVTALIVGHPLARVSIIIKIKHCSNSVHP